MRKTVLYRRASAIALTAALLLSVRAFADPGSVRSASVNGKAPARTKTCAKKTLAFSATVARQKWMALRELDIRYKYNEEFLEENAEELCANVPPPKFRPGTAISRE